MEHVHYNDFFLFTPAIATPMNTATLSQSSTDSTPSSRPSYPRTQYNMPRAHVTIDSSMSSQAMENPYVLQQQQQTGCVAGVPIYDNNPSAIGVGTTAAGFIR